MSDVVSLLVRRERKPKLLANKPTQETDAEHQHERREIKGHPTQSKRGKNPTQGKDDRIDDAVEENLNPAKGMDGRHLHPRQNYPGEDRQEVDLE